MKTTRMPSTVAVPVLSVTEFDEFPVRCGGGGARDEYSCAVRRGGGYTLVFDAFVVRTRC